MEACFHRRAAATGNALSPTVDRRVRRTSRVVDEAERNRRLDSVSTTTFDETRDHNLFPSLNLQDSEKQVRILYTMDQELSDALHTRSTDVSCALTGC